MAFVVAVAQRKGGAGKSTVAANLAATLAAAGHRVALLDTDPQQSLARWHAQRERLAPGRAVPLHFAAPSGWRIAGVLDRLRAERDLVVLDTPPHAETDAKLAIRASDLVLVPLQPSPADLWASEATLALAAGERRPAVALLNRVPAQGRLADQVAAALRAGAVRLLEPTLGNRTLFAQAFQDGLAVTEAGPRSPAADEVRALTAAVVAIALGGRA